MADILTRLHNLLRPYHTYNQGYKLDGKNARRIFIDREDRIYFRSLLARHLGERPVADRRGRLYQHLRNRVTLHAYCLMSTHYHLLLWQHDQRGIETLMSRVLSAYTRYFNDKYDNSAPLFNGPFCAKLIDSPGYFKWVVGYIHDNHRTGVDYEFSSHRPWLDPDQCPGWLDPGPALRVFGGRDEYLTYLELRRTKKSVDRQLEFGPRQ